MSENNPFLNSKFIKDVKSSFVPQQIFKNNKYKNNIIDINFKYRKNNIVFINIKLDDGSKFEYAYILKLNSKNCNDMIIDQ